MNIRNLTAVHMTANLQWRILHTVSVIHVHTQQKRFVVCFAADVTTVPLVMTSYQMSTRNTSLLNSRTLKMSQQNMLCQVQFSICNTQKNNTKLLNCNITNAHNDFIFLLFIVIANDLKQSLNLVTTVKGNPFAPSSPVIGPQTLSSHFRLPK